MTTTTIIHSLEKNKLIADFMKVNYDSGGNLRYHTSWDWLMPVVEFIKWYNQ